MSAPLDVRSTVSGIGVSMAGVLCVGPGGGGGGGGGGAATYCSWRFYPSLSCKGAGLQGSSNGKPRGRYITRCSNSASCCSHNVTPICQPKAGNYPAVSNPLIPLVILSAVQVTDRVKTIGFTLGKV